MMSDRLKDKIVIVFGAGSVGPGWGNGKATAVLFARHGAHVSCVDINRAAADETVGIIRGEGGRASAHGCDVTESAAVAEFIADIVRSHGRIDVLHNNVGYAAMGGPVELDEAAWRRSFDLNVTSCFITCKHVLPHMLARRSGAIVNVSSVAATLGCALYLRLLRRPQPRPDAAPLWDPEMAHTLKRAGDGAYVRPGVDRNDQRTQHGTATSISTAAPLTRRKIPSSWPLPPFMALTARPASAGASRARQPSRGSAPSATTTSE